MSFSSDSPFSPAKISQPVRLLLYDDWGSRADVLLAPEAEAMDAFKSATVASRPMLMLPDQAPAHFRVA